ncbi:hypothetical protein SDC9_129891 [bioreactor metagenome]|uniref:Uncharacterized protein n=1 Tax=bioreactor metagenome TaxID=1076179 RepID=A0A645D0Y1_9ZZZZ
MKSTFSSWPFSTSSITFITSSTPSTEIALLIWSKCPSPPISAHLTPIPLHWHRGSISSGFRLFIIGRRSRYTSSMEITPSTLVLRTSIGLRTFVTFAAHGLMKKIPISSAAIPLSSACFLAAIAAASIGEIIGRILSISVGNLFEISLVIAGQADDITGFLHVPSAMICLERSVIASAALATSKTSSNPSFLIAVRILFISYVSLNCA